MNPQVFLEQLQALGRLSEVLVRLLEALGCLSEALGRLSEVLSPPCLAKMVGSEGGQQQHQTSSSGLGAASVQGVSEQKGALMGFSCSVTELINTVQADTNLASRHAALSGMGGRLHKAAQQRPLLESLRPLLKLLAAGLQAKWGKAKPGASEYEVAVAKAQTVSRMLKVAQEASGGIELNR
ncbi:hypothetical protein DUNSADRAFT_9736 [Dunaliella salina]|uniref:Uncharacterized protein n=1 Tax=Dunaliella salina TaxID=3046 RepID=A0ABQ7GGU6_DUNSA|nr:hypothetical protein DUNSADRAFT_9736 [Dunaliella salina]|eukprot:KAF5833827.1 hypothetical protein DUNSADRAFT_9736 [Dunaliella salina]